MTEEREPDQLGEEEPEGLGDEELASLAEEGDDGPDVSELDEDPAYNPDNELKDLKGG